MASRSSPACDTPATWLGRQPMGVALTDGPPKRVVYLRLPFLFYDLCFIFYFIFFKKWGQLHKNFVWSMFQVQQPNLKTWPTDPDRHRRFRLSPLTKSPVLSIPFPTEKMEPILGQTP